MKEKNEKSNRTISFGSFLSLGASVLVFQK